jgi:ubiquinone/menaquinone biosynthesis C-methylase UbiE
MDNYIDKHNQTQLEYYQNEVDDYEKKGILQKTTNRAFKRKATIIAKTLGSQPKNSVLEVGAGSGLLTYFSYDLLNAKKYVAQDLSSSMVEKAKLRVQKPGLHFDVGDATKLQYADNSFDALIGTDIIHHLLEPVDALKEWLRVTAPGGRICILESNPYNPLHYVCIGDEHEVRYFLNTDHNLKKWMEAAGWKNVEILPAPSFTPAGPTILVPLFHLIDIISPKIPGWRRLTALWIVTGEKK